MDLSEIKTALGTSVRTEGYETERLRKTLAQRLKYQHPIHEKIKALNKQEFNQLYFNLSLPKQIKHIPRKMKAIAEYFFREYPDAPLTNLERVLEEDAHFAQLTNAQPTSIVEITFLK